MRLSARNQLPGTVVEIQEGAEVFELVRQGRRLTHVRTAAGDLATYRRLKLEESHMSAIERVLTVQLEHHLDRQLKSVQFLNQMRSAS